MATQVAVGTELNEVKLIRAGQRGDSQAVEALFFAATSDRCFRPRCGC